MLIQFFYFTFARIPLGFLHFMTANIVFAIHTAAIVSVFLSGLFILTVRGTKKPVIYMLMYRMTAALVMIANIFQTYDTPFYGHLLWNPLHLLSLPLTYPLLFAYMFDFMRPGKVRIRYWLSAYLPLAALLLLYFALGATRGPLPFFTRYVDMRGYLGKPELWVSFATIVFFLTELSIYVVQATRMLKEHTRNLKLNFSYTEGSTLRWMWWNIAFALLKALSVFLMMSVEGEATDVICVFVLIAEAVLTTIWVLRQEDLYSDSDSKEKQDKKTFFDKEQTGSFELSSEKRQKLIKNLFELLNKDEIFKDPELNCEKVREMLATNRTYLSQIINREMDTTFYQLINTYRLNKSVEMMKNPIYQHMQLTNIAEICGFKSLGAFSTFFKQTYGMTPTEWRETQADSK